MRKRATLKMDGAKKGDVQWWAKREQSRGSWQEAENWGRQDSHYTRAAKTPCKP